MEDETNVIIEGRHVTKQNDLPPEFAALVERQKPGWGLERPFYTDPDLFALEMERIFFSQWLFAGHISLLPEPGSYFTYQVDQESLIIIRDQGGAIHALFNVCRHKGSRICLDDCGTVQKLVCPYHQWVYELDGRLLHARLMPEDLDRASLGLDCARVRIYEGLIFLCLAPKPPPFPELPREWMAPYGFETAKVAHQEIYRVEANWKILVENFQECYHCGLVHPEYTRIMAGAASSYRSPEEEALQAGRSREEAHRALERLGLDPAAPRMQFRKGVCTSSLDGQPVAPLMGTHQQYDGTMCILWIGNTFEMEANPDYVAVFRFSPLSLTSTEVQVNWLVRGDAVAGVDYNMERLTEFWKITGEQDWRICEVVQSGVNSHRYRPGPLAHGESDTNAFIQRYLMELGA